MNEIETWHGMVETTADALRIFELCRQGKLARVKRRLYDRERRLIRSGSVFVFDEKESGIRRWTDGRLWSPSRIHGNFLIYRELERKTRVSSHDRDQNRWQNRNRSKRERMESTSGLENTKDILEEKFRSSYYPASMAQSLVFSSGHEEDLEAQDRHALHSNGSEHDLVMVPHYRHRSDSLPSQRCKEKPLQQGRKLLYFLKEDGFIKKTITATCGDDTQHLVCYYSKKDFVLGHSSCAFPEETRSTLYSATGPTDLAAYHQNEPANELDDVTEDIRPRTNIITGQERANIYPPQMTRQMQIAPSHTPLFPTMVSPLPLPPAASMATSPVTIVTPDGQAAPALMMIPTAISPSISDLGQLGPMQPFHIMPEPTFPYPVPTMLEPSLAAAQPKPNDPLREPEPEKTLDACMHQLSTMDTKDRMINMQQMWKEQAEQHVMLRASSSCSPFPEEVAQGTSLNYVTMDLMEHGGSSQDNNARQSEQCDMESDDILYIVQNAIKDDPFSMSSDSSDYRDTSHA